MQRNSKIYHNKLVFYPIALITILVFILVATTKLILPRVDTYQDQIESIIGNYTGYSVEIDRVNAEWKNWAPNLNIEDIGFYKTKTDNEILRFNSIEIGIDLLSSISKMEIIPSYILISGINLNINRNKNGEISIENNNIVNENNIDNKTGLIKWLFTQKNLRLENINLSWNDDYLGTEKIDFDNASMNIKIQEENLIINLAANLPEQKEKTILVNANVNVNPTTKKWYGDIDLELINLDPSKIFNKFAIFKSGGVANSRIKTKWNNAKLINFSGDINYDNFSLSSEELKVFYNNINLSISGDRKLQKNWLVTTDIMNVDTVNGKWPTKKYQFEIIQNPKNNGFELSAKLPFLKLHDILPLILKNKLIPDEVLKKIDPTSVSSTIEDIILRIDANETDQLELKKMSGIFSNLNIVSYDKSNSISNLNGKFTANDKIINVKIDSNLTKLKYSKLFKKEKEISKISADLKYAYVSKNELLIKNMVIIYNEISSISNGKIIFNEYSPFIDISAKLNQSNIQYMADYIPDINNPKLHAWLESAILGGTITSGDITYNGSEHEENFMQNFNATVYISNTDVAYDEEWPKIENIEAEITIKNNNLISKVFSANIFNADINESSISIDNIDNNNDDAHIIINSSGYSHISDLKIFIEQSPLKRNAAFSEHANNIDGSFNINLNLDIPLGKEKTIFDGFVSLDKNSIRSELLNFHLENVIGDIYFSVDEIYANNISAIYMDIPIELKIPTTNYDNLNIIPLDMSLIANKIFVLEQMTKFFPELENNIETINKYFDGESNWNIIFNQSEQNKSSSEIGIRLITDLSGIKINLPKPLKKNSNEIKILELIINFDQSSNAELNIAYENQIFADIFIKNQFIKNINIGFGTKHPQADIDNTISLRGDIKNFNLSDWKNIFDISKTVNDNEKNKKFIGNINIGSFGLLDNDFQNVNVDLLSLDNNNKWIFKFDSEKINGEAKYIKKNKEQDEYLSIDFERLSLGKSKNANNNVSYEINRFPELDVSINNFIYEDKNLGQLSLKTTKTDNIVNINKLDFNKPGFTIHSSGNWSNIDDTNKSEFEMTFKSESIKLMLDTFNYETANIENGETRIELSANWNGSPMDFSVANLNGKLNMEIAEGQFLDIEPKAGRLFGLLSIQALPRRLSLDFADFFDKGFAFDSIKGNFSIEKGQAYTNDLQMLGPAGDITISGRTGLETEDYDQIATVVPKVSDSLPVASALFGPVGVGVGAVIYFAGELFDSIPSNIDKILTQQYSIKGSWEDPEIEKININK